MAAAKRRKLCPGCNKRRALSKFGKDKRRKDSLRSRCVTCSSAERKASRSKKKTREDDTPDQLASAQQAALEARETDFPMVEAVVRRLVNVDTWSSIILAQISLAKRSVTAARFLRDELTKVRTAEVLAREEGDPDEDSPERKAQYRQLADAMLQTEAGKTRAAQLLEAMAGGQ